MLHTLRWQQPAATSLTSSGQPGNGTFSCLPLLAPTAASLTHVSCPCHAQIPSDPKLILSTYEPDKLSKFFLTTVEQQPRRELLLPADVGVPIRCGLRLLLGCIHTVYIQHYFALELVCKQPPHQAFFTPLPAGLLVGGRTLPACAAGSARGRGGSLPNPQLYMAGT